MKDIPSRGATVDTRFQPRNHLLQYIEGKPWHVDYFQIVIGPDDETSQQQSDVAAAFQQYRCIHGFQIMVTTTLNSGTSQDEQTKDMIVEGTSNLYPGVVPNHGDVFLGDIGDGREGLFRVTATTKKTHMREACYEITYNLVGYSDRQGEFIQDLQRKTVQDLWWHQDYYTYGQDAKLTTPQYNTVIELDRLFTEMIDHYFLEFFSVEKQTLLVPAQEQTTYDPFMTRFVMRLINHDYHRDADRIRLPTVQGHLVNRYMTVLDAIIERNARYLRMATHRTRLFNTNIFKAQPLYSGIYYTGIVNVVFPFAMPESNDLKYYCKCPEIVSEALMRAGPPKFDDLERLISATLLDGLYWKHVTEHPNGIGIDNLKDINSVTVDDHYIFSAMFYNNMRPTSKLEHLVLQHLNHEAVDRELLRDLASKSLTWNPVERFYYVPVLWAMMISVSRGY